ncbi:hypothetical protein Tco_1563984 [Tanacetum coccineum]
MDKCKTGLGYNVVPPPYTGNFMPPKSDLVYPSLDDFVDVNESVSESIVEKPTVETNEPKTARKENRAPIIEDWVSDSDEENVPKVKTVKMFNKPSFAKINFVKSTEQVKSPRKTLVDKNRQNTPSPRRNKRNLIQQINYQKKPYSQEDMAPNVLLPTLRFKAATYKRGLETLEDQIVKYKEHEVRFSEEIALLKRSVGSKEYQLGLLRIELEKVKQEKEGVNFKIAKFDKSAKDLNKMLESQITNKSKKGVGLEEFKEPEINEYVPRDSSLKPTTGCDKESNNSKENTDDSLEQHQMTDTQTSSFKSPLKVDKDWKEKFFYPANHVESVNQIEKPVKRTVRYAEIFEHLQYTCKHKRHVNDQKQVKPVWNNSKRVNDHYSTRMTDFNPRRNMIPQAVLMRSGIKAVNTAKLKDAHNAVKRNRFNDVKASTCWVWMPKNRVIDHVSKYNSASVTLKRLDYIDAQGRFKSMDALTQGRQECNKEKEESREECSKSRKTKKMKFSTARITAVGEKVNAAESLLVVSTEVNAD